MNDPISLRRCLPRNRRPAQPALRELRPSRDSFSMSDQSAHPGHKRARRCSHPFINLLTVLVAVVSLTALALSLISFHSAARPFYEYDARIPVSADGAGIIIGKWAIESIEFHRGQIDDHALADLEPDLEALPKLRSLSIEKQPITDLGLSHLEGLTNLRSLVLYETDVTEDGVEALRESLPVCEIEFVPRAPDQEPRR